MRWRQCEAVQARATKPKSRRWFFPARGRLMQHRVLWEPRLVSCPVRYRPPARVGKLYSGDHVLAATHRIRPSVGGELKNAHGDGLRCTGGCPNDRERAHCDNAHADDYYPATAHGAINQRQR